jgi:hypothetical protein
VGKVVSIRHRQRLEERLRERVETALSELNRAETVEERRRASDRLRRALRRLNAVALAGPTLTR